MAARPQAPPEVIKEYELCHEKSAKLGERVWNTASLFGVGSLDGILAIAAAPIQDGLRPWLVGGLTVFAIALLLAWRRIVGRWWSIEHAYLRRMEHIERQFQMRATLYVARLDNRVSFENSLRRASLERPYLPQPLSDDLRSMENTHQREGLVAVADFIVQIGIAIWLSFAAIVFMPVLAHLFDDSPVIFMRAIVLGVLMIWLVWRFLAMNRRL